MSKPHNGKAGTVRRTLGVLLGVLALTATISSGAAAATPPDPHHSDAPPRLVPVRMVDYALLQPEFLPPGRYTFRAYNAGIAPHSLQIYGPGVLNARTPTVQSGRFADLTVTLQRGTYDFWCPIGNHRQVGMQLSVKVG